MKTSHLLSPSVAFLSTVFPTCANRNISVEHERALRPESFIAAFRGLPMR